MSLVVSLVVGAAKAEATSAVPEAAVSSTVLSLAVLPTLVVRVVEKTVTSWRKEKSGKGKVKGFPLSKQMRVVLERENKFFLRRKF